MRVFDPSDTQPKAFLRGFLSGFCAPVTLFANYDTLLDENVHLVTVRNVSAMEALSEDMRRVGGDLRIAMEKYAAENHIS